MVQVDTCGRFSVGGHSTSEPPPYVWEIPYSVSFCGRLSDYRIGENRCSLFWARVPLLQQQWGIWRKLRWWRKEDRQQKSFFFFNFSVIECRELFRVVPVIATTLVCGNSSDKSTSHGIQAPGASSAGVSSCGIPHSKMAAAVPLCSLSWSELRAGYPDSLCSWPSGDYLSYPRSCQILFLLKSPRINFCY